MRRTVKSLRVTRSVQWVSGTDVRQARDTTWRAWRDSEQWHKASSRQSSSRPAAPFSSPLARHGTTATQHAPRLHLDHPRSGLHWPPALSIVQTAWCRMSTTAICSHQSVIPSTEPPTTTCSRIVWRNFVVATYRNVQLSELCKHGQSLLNMPKFLDKKNFSIMTTMMIC